MGYSSRLSPPYSRMTTKLLPSGDQSAHWTSSSTSRGAPPDIGTLPNVPTLIYGSTLWLWSSTAISPSDEIDRTSAFDSPNGRDSGLPGRVMNSSIGLPSHAAP